MKIKIKTTLIEIEIEDDVKIGSDGFTKRTVPELSICIKSMSWIKLNHLYNFL
jgi:hypothetical protein